MSAQSDCRCVSSLLRIVDRVAAVVDTEPANQQQHQQHQPPLRISLSEILTLGGALYRQWEDLNGCCVRSETHGLDLPILRGVAQAANSVLRLYELVIDEGPAGCEGASSMRQNFNSTTTTNNNSGSNSNSNAASQSQAMTWVRPPTYLGKVCLVGEDEAIVLQEALRQSAVRLGHMLTDVKDDLGQGESDATERRSSIKLCDEGTRRVFRIVAKTSLPNM